MLEYRVDLTRYVKLPKQKRSAAYSKYLDDVFNGVSKLLSRNATKAEVNAFITQMNQQHYVTIANSFRDNFATASGKTWAEIAATDSFGITLGNRVNKSINMSFKRVRAETLNLHTRLSLANPEDIQKIAERFSRGYAKSVSDSLKYNSKRLNETERRRIKQEKRDATLEGKVIWRFGNTTNHCEICESYEGTVYATASDAPPRPVHPNCDCYLEETK